MDEWIDEGVFRWFGHDRIIKRVYVGRCAGSRSVSRPRKRWTDTVKHYLKEIGVDIVRARRKVYDRRE